MICTAIVFRGREDLVFTPKGTEFFTAFAPVKTALDGLATQQSSANGGNPRV